MQIKMAITISLDEMGRVNFQSTSQNLISQLGMLEAAKAIVFANMKPVEKSPIEIPN